MPSLRATLTENRKARFVLQGVSCTTMKFDLQRCPLAHSSMKNGLSFLIAAKRSEMSQLHQLARTSVWVNAIASLVHGLQRERGLSNVMLASNGRLQVAQRLEQVEACQQLEQKVREAFSSLDTDSNHPEHGARLFSRIAYAQQGLDALPYLRQQVTSQIWTPLQATAAYVKLVAGLLAVVFEAADSAGDPEISRLLVSLFNFMQGKEFAGQERAAGSASYASAQATQAAQQKLLHLLESQERCLQVFHDFSSVSMAGLWHQSQQGEHLAELERMRRLLCTATDGAPLDPNHSAQWFEVCTRRIDSMREIENRLAQDLLVLCEQRLARAAAELKTYQGLQDDPASDGGLASASQAKAFFDEPPTPPRTKVPQAQTGISPLALPIEANVLGPQLGGSILELVREQSQRMQAMAAELDTARVSLNERKLVERAKGLLMAHRQLSEDEAHKLLRNMAMGQNRRMVDVAQAVLSMADVLPVR